MKKEYYRHNLPHFQLPGQAYFVTWILKDAIPQKVLNRYSDRLEILRAQLKEFGSDVANQPGATNTSSLIKKTRFGNRITLEGATNSDSLIIKRGSESASPELVKLQKEYYTLRKKYMKAYDDLLAADKNSKINLSKPENTNAVTRTLKFWDTKKLENYAFCIMPNHIHWVFRLFDKDENGEPVFLQDILYSVKRFSANQINKLENKTGTLWQKESFDTTMRNEEHLYYAVQCTLDNPVNAGLVKKREDWAGNFLSEKF